MAASAASNSACNLTGLVIDVPAEVDDRVVMYEGPRGVPSGDKSTTSTNSSLSISKSSTSCASMARISASSASSRAAAKGDSFAKGTWVDLRAERRMGNSSRGRSRAKKASSEIKEGEAWGRSGASGCGGAASARVVEGAGAVAVEVDDKVEVDLIGEPVLLPLFPELQLLLLQALLPANLPLPLSPELGSRLGLERERYEGLKNVCVEEEFVVVVLIGWLRLGNRLMIPRHFHCNRQSAKGVGSVMKTKKAWS